MRRETAASWSRGRIFWHSRTPTAYRPRRGWNEVSARFNGCRDREASAAGSSLPFTRSTDRTAAELFESVFGFRQEQYVGWGFAATANLFTTRNTFDRVGLFDERMMSGGDQKWGHRLQAQGLAQHYADDVCVIHPARRTLAQLYRKTVRVAGGLQQIAEEHHRGTSGLLRNAVQELILLRSIRTHISDEILGPIDQRLRFACAVWMVELVRTLERYRVHYGGTPRRA